MPKPRIIDGKKLSIILPAFIHYWIKREAMERGVTESAVVQDMFYAHWKSSPEHWKEINADGNEGSFAMMWMTVLRKADEGKGIKPAKPKRRDYRGVDKHNPWAEREPEPDPTLHKALKPAAKRKTAKP